MSYDDEYARRSMARRCAWRSGWPVAALLTTWLAAAGCRTVDYTARNMPDALRVSPAPSVRGINLAQLGGSGGGSSLIGPGDLVEVTIASGRSEERPEPLPARVTRDGAIMVPTVGVVSVGGMEPPEAEQQIAAAAVERGIYRQPSVTLRVTEKSVNHVSVLGAVAKPGVVELPRGASDLVSALAAAGGLTEDASTSVDVLRHDSGPTFLAGEPIVAGPRAPDGVRTASYDAAEPPLPNPQTTRIDLAQAVAVPRGSNNLSDRDVVMVLPKEKQVIHVTGLVHRPDQFEITADQDIHVLDAIAMAGGTKLPIADKVFVIRRLPDRPEPAVIKVSIARAKRDGRENLRLAPGDLVSVEATVATMVVDTATNFFRVAVGLSGNVATF